MPAEQREQQNVNLAKQPWHLRSEDGLTKKSGWIPDLGWEARISLRMQRDKTATFANLMKHINMDTLKEAYEALDGTKALGVDRVSKEAYGKKLEENLTALLDRAQKGNYRPQPKREVLIPKPDGKKRPLAIGCFEDKLVDWVVSKILSAVYEPIFIRNSFGYREGKSTDQAMRACYNSLHKGKRPYVVEIDFKSFFNTIPHRKLLSFIGKRIEDHRLKRLILRLLQTSVIREDGNAVPTKIGTPQGGLASPVLANIYLHEVLDIWFLENWASHTKTIVRYADDAVFFFDKEEDARRFLKELELRTEHYGLTLHPDKTKMLKMNKASQESFDFLGFTFYWGKQHGTRLLKIKTQKKKLHKAMQEFDKWVKENRSRYKLKELWERAKMKIEGHLNYFGFAHNNLKCFHFCREALKSMFKWINRRSQKRSYNWDGFLERLKWMPLFESFEQRKWKQIGKSFGRI